MNNKNDKRNTNGNNDSYIRLSNGRYVHPDFLNWVRDVATERIPSLTSDVKYTLQQIFSDFFWNKLSDGEHRRAGWCMVHLAEKQELPLISVNKYRYQYPKRYQLQ